MIWATAHKDAFKCDCDASSSGHTSDCIYAQFVGMLEDETINSVLNKVFDLDYRLTAGYKIDPDDLPADVYIGHRILLEERERLNQELHKSKQT